MSGQLASELLGSLLSLLLISQLEDEYAVHSGPLACQVFRAQSNVSSLWLGCGFCVVLSVVYSQRLAVQINCAVNIGLFSFTMSRKQCAFNRKCTLNLNLE